MKPKKLPTQTELHHLLDYDPLTAVFTWKYRHELRGSASTFNKRYAFKKAGRKRRDGIWTICINRISYLAHRIAWMYIYGIDPGILEIDHINVNHSDNRINNLRLASKSENRCNRDKGKTLNPFKGVFATKNGTRWYVRVRKDYKCYDLGYFDSVEDARNAYNKKAEEMHGKFFRKS